MIFTGSESPRKLMKKVTSSLSMRKKKNVNDHKQKDLRREKSSISVGGGVSTKVPIKKLDLVCKTRKKSADVSPRQSLEIDDLDAYLRHESESMWLSSDASSPSVFLEQHRFSSSPFQFPVDDWVISWLSDLADSCLSLDKGINSLNEKTNNSRIEKSSNVENISPNLDGGNSKEILEKLEKPDTSPAKVASEKDNTPLKDLLLEKVNETTTADLKGSLLEKVGETADLKGSTTGEPIFWPFEQKFDWTAEDIKCFTVSPRRSLVKDVTPVGISPRSIRLQLNERKVDTRSRLASNSGSAQPKTPDSKQKSKISNSNNSQIKNAVKRTNSMPSRLRKSSTMSMKVVPVESAEETRKPASKNAPGRKSIQKKRTLSEVNYSWLKELPIETVMGLDEFSGNEGIDSVFHGDFFLLDVSL